ncbi:hypothetical protein EVA_09840 [gut metagenome]|uniref:Uncharacterized protein n=1 Tax=gut metagenome TaxID=749906 RepID=J9GPZ7_9ZZZZ
MLSPPSAFPVKSDDPLWISTMRVPCSSSIMRLTLLARKSICGSPIPGTKLTSLSPIFPQKRGSEILLLSVPQPISSKSAFQGVPKGGFEMQKWNFLPG